MTRAEEMLRDNPHIRVAMYVNAERIEEGDTIHLQVAIRGKGSCILKMPRHKFSVTKLMAMADEEIKVKYETGTPPG